MNNEQLIIHNCILVVQEKGAFIMNDSGMLGVMLAETIVVLLLLMLAVYLIHCIVKISKNTENTNKILKDIQGQMYALKRQLSAESGDKAEADTYIVTYKTNNETETE